MRIISDFSLIVDKISELRNAVKTARLDPSKYESQLSIFDSWTDFYNLFIDLKGEKSGEFREAFDFYKSFHDYIKGLPENVQNDPSLQSMYQDFERIFKETISDFIKTKKYD